MTYAEPLSTPHSTPGTALHFAHWPPALPRRLTVPETNVFHNAEVSAARFPDKPFVIFYDTLISFSEFLGEAERIAGYLTHDCGVRAGDRVLLYMQNSPQWVLAFYGILRANAVVVPVNPMNRLEELRHYVADTGATTAFVPQDLLAQMQPLLASGGDGNGIGLQHLIVACYGDYLKRETDLRVPDFVAAPRQALAGDGLVAWADMLAANRRPGPLTQGAGDLAVMPYTSGTTGQPKGCMHTHRSLMSSLVGGIQWFGRTQDAVFLSVLPWFHVTGLVGSLNGPLFIGATIVVLPRWDRDTATLLMQRYRVNTWQAITTMVVDFASNPALADHDLSSLKVVRGGGAAMPEAVALQLRALTGLDYTEGYGMSETMAATHINPMHRPKPQCLGMPVFDVDARIVDPQTLVELPQGDSGEIIVAGPQVMLGYWNNPAATENGFIDRDGKRFLRTGDLARIDEDGYFFMVDRLKRMINASGYKVWPAEVEALMYHHPAILEACVIAAKDTKRGETVKALVVLKESYRGQVGEAEIIQWAHDHMAVYKSPRIVEFVASLPKSGSGKVQWRELQEAEAARDAAAIPHPLRARTSDSAIISPPVTTPAPETPFGTIAELVRRHAATRPDQAALIGAGDDRLSYGELDALMDRVSASLQRDGIVPGAAIALCAASTPAYAAVFLGALRAAVAVAPLAASVTPASFSSMLRDADARWLFIDESAADALGGDADPARCISLDGIAPGLPFAEWLMAPGARPTPVDVQPGWPFNIIYSSGTTGTPKGIVQSHGMRWSHVARGASYGYSADGRTLLATPLYSNTTLVVFFPTIAFGGTVILMPKFDAARYLALAQAHRVTHTMLVPVQYQRIMALPSFDAHRLDSFLFKFCTSAPFNALLKGDVVRRWPGGLIEFYGMTEGGGTCILAAHEHPTKLHTVGPPALGHDIRLIDEEGRELPHTRPSPIGEVVGHSGGMMTGYNHQPAKTREAEWFDASGKRFIRTGDVGRFDADGFLVLMDRRKDLVISGGFNIYPSDLEAVLREHLAVEDVAVVGVPSQVWGETPIAFVVARRGEAPPDAASAQALMQWLNDRVGKTQRLAGLFYIDELPRSAIGKVLKRDLRDLHVASGQAPR